jgi:hypothetical protein
MSEERRGRRPPLLTSNFAQVIPIENAEGAPSTVFEI